MKNLSETQISILRRLNEGWYILPFPPAGFYQKDTLYDGRISNLDAETLIPEVDKASCNLLDNGLLMPVNGTRYCFWQISEHGKQALLELEGEK